MITSNQPSTKLHRHIRLQSRIRSGFSQVSSSYIPYRCNDLFNRARSPLKLTSLQPKMDTIFKGFWRSILGLITLAGFILETNAQTGSEYLDPHNAARASVGVVPALSNLSWSVDLAAYAKEYAQSQVSQCLPLTHSYGRYGENLFWGSGKDWTPLDAVTAWTDEMTHYDYARNTCMQGQMCGHYTQVVWNSSTHVGCAEVECADGSDYIICSYNPPGNWIGERPY